MNVFWRRRVWVELVAAVFAAALLTAEAHADTYTYDAYGRLTGVTYSDGSTVTYTYDHSGNRVTVTKTP